MENQNFSFAFIADPQIGMNSPFGLNGPGSDGKRLEYAVKYINENDIDLALFGGDHINEPQSGEQLDVFMECLSNLKVPYYGIPGNHDQLHPNYKESIYFGRNAPNSFSVTHKGVFFLGLNASMLRRDFGEGPQQEEWDFMQNQFKQAPVNCTHRFVVMHWPLFNRHPEEEDTYWNMPNRKQLITFFKDHDVSCVLSGHWQQDIDANWNGVSLITSIGTSMPLQYPEELSFKVITVFEEGWLARRVSVESF